MPAPSNRAQRTKAPRRNRQRQPAIRDDEPSADGGPYHSLGSSPQSSQLAEEEMSRQLAAAKAGKAGIACSERGASGSSAAAVPCYGRGDAWGEDDGHEQRSSTQQGSCSRAVSQGRQGAYAVPVPASGIHERQAAEQASSGGHDQHARQFCGAVAELSSSKADGQEQDMEHDHARDEGSDGHGDGMDSDEDAEADSLVSISRHSVQDMHMQWAEDDVLAPAPGYGRDRHANKRAHRQRCAARESATAPGHAPLRGGARNGGVGSGQRGQLVVPSPVVHGDASGRAGMVGPPMHSWQIVRPRSVILASSLESTE